MLTNIYTNKPPYGINTEYESRYDLPIIGSILLFNSDWDSPKVFNLTTLNIYDTNTEFGVHPIEFIGTIDDDIFHLTVDPEINAGNNVYGIYMN